jgi:hypothetical protein
MKFNSECARSPGGGAMGEEQVFQFCSSASLERLTGKRAYNLDELLMLIKSCSESAVFYHTFSALRKLRQVNVPYTNDFAIWIYRNLGEEALAEKLGAIDYSEYNTIEALRSRIVGIIDDHHGENPDAFLKKSDEPFHLYDVVRFIYLTDKFAYDLKSFRQILSSISLDSLYFHFIESRLRTKLHVDDFSVWIEHSLKLDSLARSIMEIDINVYTLEEMRGHIECLIDAHLGRASNHKGP